MPQNPINNQALQEVFTQLGLKVARSGNYTVSAADIAAGWSQPIEILWDAPYADGNYTVLGLEAEQILGVNAPKALWAPVQFSKLIDGSGAGGGRSQGIIVVVQLLTNAKAGDIFVVHAAAIHD